MNLINFENMMAAKKILEGYDDYFSELNYGETSMTLREYVESTFNKKNADKIMQLIRESGL